VFVLKVFDHYLAYILLANHKSQKTKPPPLRREFAFPMESARTSSWDRRIELYKQGGCGPAAVARSFMYSELKGEKLLFK